MSKLSSETVEKAVQDILMHALKHKRGFLETIELQVALKNYDPTKDKKIAGSIKLPHLIRPRFKVCVLGNAHHVEVCHSDGIDVMSVEDLQKMKKDKKQVKKLAHRYGAFLASANLIKKVPRLVGPWLNKAGKFPSPITNTDNLPDKISVLRSTVTYKLKNKKTLCLGVAVANVGMKEEEIIANLNMAVNFLVSLLKKNWQSIKRLYIKSTMGPVHKIYGI